MTNEFELFSDLDFDDADRILARMEAEAAVRRDIVTSLRVSNALLRGRVLDAEALIATMQDPVSAKAELADWKRRYAGMPHGQWNGEW